MCRETVPEIGGGDWKGPPTDSSDALSWRYQIVATVTGCQICIT